MACGSLSQVLAWGKQHQTIDTELTHAGSGGEQESV